MASRRSKWLIGCGAGCGLVVIALIAIFVAGAAYLRNSFKGVGEAEQSYRELASRYGEVEEFVPPPDGAVPAERVELFLSVRESLGQPRRELVAALADFPPDDVIGEERALFVILGAVRGIVDLVGPISGYIDQRHRLLLEAGMGPGEYVYIYSVAYYSWLGRSPGEGPLITKQAGNRLREQRGEPLFDDSDSPFEADRVRRRYRRYMLSLLRNQLNALPGPGGGSETDASRAALDEEIRRFESRPDRIAWQDGLPPAVERSLEPYRARFEATWDGTTNPFELPLRESEGWGRGGRE
jgi:hypothetical protein